MPASPSDPIRIEAEGDRFHLLMDAVTDYAIYLLDTGGFVTTWNKGAERLKGYAEAEAIGQHYARFFPPADQDAGLPQRILAHAKAHGRCEIEGWRVRKDGSTFWALAVLHAVIDKQGNHIGFAKVTRDMTERRTAQLALAESERRFRLLVSSVTDYAIFMLDLSGQVTNWNAGAARIKGYTEAEIIGRHFSRFYTWEDRAAGLPARVLDTAAREGRYEAEALRVRKDGTKFWAAVVIDAVHDETGQLIGFANVTRDITERRLAQAALHDSERQFRLLMSSVTDYALFMLDLNGIVTTWNAGARRIKGYEAHEIIGQHFSRFYTEADRAAGLPARSLHAAATQGRFETEALRVRKDGSSFWANVVIDPVHDEQGNLAGFAKITRDITERHDAQKALQDAQVHLAQAQKMEALGQLTGGVAHDFNNLLMVVSGYIHTLKDRLSGDERGLRAANAIEEAARRGEGLTRQLLSFSRRQSLRPGVLDIRETVVSVRPMLTSSVKGRVRIIETLAADVWPVRLDANEFELALLNLAVNARDAMGQEGIVTLTAENVTVTRGSVPGGIEGDFVAVSVADTGAGIPPDILPKVFDPFFTTKGVGKGTGLGLSQVHGFAYQSGGSVTIRSELGKGTSVTLYLPRATGRAVPAAEHIPTGVIGSDHTVLVVEDNPDVADATRELLRRLGCQVEIANDGEAALQILSQTRFDLVLSDIVMAGTMNGLELGRQIRNRHPGVPVLLATGYSSAAQEAATEFTVLRKPYQLAALSTAVEAALGQRREPAGSGAHVVSLHGSGKRGAEKRPTGPSAA